MAEQFDVSNPFRTGRYCAASLIAPNASSRLVSNPFRTGRYCAVRPNVGKERKNARFKPLQNGAVLCCYAKPTVDFSDMYVSNPFRTGRYCAVGDAVVDCERTLVFQTPSERGGIVLIDVVVPELLASQFQTPSERGGIVLLVVIGQYLEVGREFQTPSERGGIVLLLPTDPPFPPLVFQTPSERGGIVLL